MEEELTTDWNADRETKTIDLGLLMAGVQRFMEIGAETVTDRDKDRRQNGNRGRGKDKGCNPDQRCLINKTGGCPANGPREKSK